MPEWKVILIASCLCLMFLYSWTNRSEAAEQEGIRKEITRLRGEISERLQQIAALESQLSSTDARMGLDGYCPVTLVNEQKWVIGSADHGLTHERSVYFFVDAQRMQEFQKTPEKYIPAMGGHDPVIWFEKGERIVGHRKHGIFCDGKVVLFASEKSLSRFCDAPLRYLNLDDTGPSHPPPAELEDRDAQISATVVHRQSRGASNGRLRCYRRRVRRR